MVTVTTVMKKRINQEITKDASGVISSFGDILRRAFARKMEQAGGTEYEDIVMCDRHSNGRGA